jgi:hypothetical protein
MIVMDVHERQTPLEPMRSDPADLVLQKILLGAKLRISVMVWIDGQAESRPFQTGGGELALTAPLTLSLYKCAFHLIVAPNFS